MILLLSVWVNYYKKNPLMSSRERRGAQQRHWMKSTGGGRSDGTIVPYDSS